MDKLNINGIVLTPLKKIQNPLGDVFHGMKKSDVGFSGFGEAYFTKIDYGAIKGWNRHKEMTLNLIVPFGEVAFVIYDNRDGSSTFGNHITVNLSTSNYQRLTVPPGLWVAFKGKKRKTSLILNVANMEHDPEEINRLNLSQIDFNWDSI